MTSEWCGPAVVGGSRSISSTSGGSCEKAVEARVLDLRVTLEFVQPRELSVTTPRSRRSLEVDAMMPAMRQMLEEGLSYGEVARTLGVNRQTVALRLPGFGWSKSDGGRFGMTNRYASAQIKKVWYGTA